MEGRVAVVEVIGSSCDEGATGVDVDGLIVGRWVDDCVAAELLGS